MERVVIGLLGLSIRVVLPLLLLGAVHSCSIKEDRSGCPCRLTIDFSEVDAAAHPAMVVSLSDDNGFSYSDTLRVGTAAGEAFPEEYTVNVPRGGVRLNVWSDVPAEYLSDTGLSIPEGQTCPPVFMHSASVETGGETARETVHLHKNYCALTVNFVLEESAFPYSLRMRGEVDGYGLDGRPRAGDFRYGFHLSDFGESVVSLPRQNDASLILELLEGGELLRSFAVGNYIASSGYDWTSADLRDLTLWIDYSNTRITLSVVGWEDVYAFELTI